MAQNQQNMYQDKHRMDIVFKVEDLLYLILQPYKKYSLKNKGDEKLQPRFYEPYNIIRKVCEVAYELDFPANNKLHNVFNVSCLKKEVGQQIVASQEIPPLDDEYHLVLVPDKVLMGRKRKLRNKTIKEYLIQWKGLPNEDATWEGEQIL